MKTIKMTRIIVNIKLELGLVLGLELGLESQLGFGFRVTTRGSVRTR